MIRVLNALSGVVVVSMAVYFAKFEPPVLSYGSIDEKGNVVNVQRPFTVLNPQVHVGENLQIRVVRCSTANEERTYTSTRTFIPTQPGLQRVILDGTSTSVMPGCTPSISTLMVVPKGTPPGQYYAAGIATISSTIGLDKLVRWSTEPFEVLP